VEAQGFKHDIVQLIQVLEKINAGGAAHAMYWYAQQNGRAALCTSSVFITGTHMLEYLDYYKESIRKLKSFNTQAYDKLLTSELWRKSNSAMEWRKTSEKEFIPQLLKKNVA
jgi:hypothetical protein